MDEIFGEENCRHSHLAEGTHRKLAKHLSEDDDYVLIYARRAEDWRPALLPRTEEMEARYGNPTTTLAAPGNPATSSTQLLR